MVISDRSEPDIRDFHEDGSAAWQYEHTLLLAVIPMQIVLADRFIVRDA